MGVGTGGTFAQDARNISMGASDIQALQEQLNPRGNKGWIPYQFKGKKYQVQYEREGVNLTFLAIKSV